MFLPSFITYLFLEEDSYVNEVLVTILLLHIDRLHKKRWQPGSEP